MKWYVFKYPYRQGDKPFREFTNKPGEFLLSVIAKKENTQVVLMSGEELNAKNKKVATG